MRKRRLYRVEWEDTASSGGWRREDDVLKEQRGTVSIVTVGYFMRRNKKEILLCQSYDEYDKTNDRIAIPMACVKRIRRLKEKG